MTNAAAGVENGAAGIALSLTIVTYFLARWMMWKIVISYHYQRVREIVWVLNTVDANQFASEELRSYLSAVQSSAKVFLYSRAPENHPQDPD
jgi:hypothetical protein